MNKYGWYVLNKFWDDGRGTYPVSPDERYQMGVSSPQQRLDNLKDAGLLDEEVTFDNIIPLLDQYTKAQREWSKNWDLFRKEHGTLLETLHWVLGNILMDPSIDQKILMHVIEHCAVGVLHISIAHNAGASESVFNALLDKNAKKDTTGDTKGGEIGCFCLNNPNVQPNVIDRIVRKTKKAFIKKDAINHKNTSTKTLSFILESSTSDAIKKEVLFVLYQKGGLHIHL